MSWRVIIRPNAEADVREARQWYESQRTGLGDELLEEIRSGWEEVSASPALRVVAPVNAGETRGIA